MVDRLSVVLRALSFASIATLGALLACSDDQGPGPIQPESARSTPRPNPRNANAPAFSERALSPAAAVITNGVIALGVQDQGHLNIPGAGPPSSGTSSTTAVGLRFVPTNSEATAPGCLCEGWGASGNGVAGFANIASDGGVNNLTLVSFTTTATTAISIVDIPGAGLRVTHDFHPSTNPNLYEVDVTIQNTSGAPVTDVRYRRVMDWDIAPNTFSEFVTIQGSSAPAVLNTSNDGFSSANPLAPITVNGVSVLFTGDFTDRGPDDHGALFTFSFGTLAPGESKTFQIYYGATADEASAFVAMQSVGAEVFSFGQADCSNCSAWVPAPGNGHPTGGEGAATGRPHTFIFAFAGLGGSVVVPPPGGGGADECGVTATSAGVRRFSFGGVTMFIGTSGDDTVRGTNGPDVIATFGGDDTVSSRGGIDSVDLGSGDDLACLGNDNDFAFGKEGGDEIRGQSGDDRIDGGHTPVPSSSEDEDSDTCIGGPGTDRFFLCETIVN